MVVNDFMRTHALDTVIVAMLALAAATLSWRTSGAALAAVGDRDRVWFGAEVNRTLHTITADKVKHDRTLHYPLMTSVMRIPTRMVRRVAPQIDPAIPIRLTLSAAAGAWVAGVFLMCRAMRCPPVAAILLALIGASSAGAVFWSGIPDVVVVAAASVPPAIAVAALAAHRTVPVTAWLAAVSGSIALAVPNGLTGAIAAAMHFRGRVALQLVANAATVIIVLCTIQRFVYPSLGRLIDHDVDDRPAARATLVAAPFAPVVPFLTHGVVMPSVVTNAGSPALQVGRGPATPAGGVALIAWAGVLLIGMTAAAPAPAARIRAMLLVALAAQLALQLLFEADTFRNAMNTLPLMIGLAAIGSLSSWRTTTVTLSVILLAGSAINNAQAFQRSLELVPAVTVAPSR